LTNETMNEAQTSLRDSLRALPRGASPAVPPGCEQAVASLAVGMAIAAGAVGTTIFHPVGTCKMGQDDSAVVDDCLRVRGVLALRVVDASRLPARDRAEDSGRHP